MQQFKFLGLLSLLFLYAGFGYANQFPNPNANIANHSINFHLPNFSAWQLENRQADAGGDTEVYRLISGPHTQRLTLNFGRNISTSLQDSMQEVLNSQSMANCYVKQSKVLEQRENLIIFTTSLDQCSNGKSLYQIYKVFNTDDGQYAISYGVDNPGTMEPSVLKQMRSVVETARIQ